MNSNAPSLFSARFFVALFAPLAAAAQAAGNAPDPNTIESLFAGKPWEYGVFVDGGVGTGNRTPLNFSGQDSRGQGTH